MQASDVLDAEKICEEWMDHPDNKGKGSFSIDYVASKDGEHPKKWHRPNNGAKEVSRREHPTCMPPCRLMQTCFVSFLPNISCSATSYSSCCDMLLLALHGQNINLVM